MKSAGTNSKKVIIKKICVEDFYLNKINGAWRHKWNWKTSLLLLVQQHWPLFFTSCCIHHGSLFWNGFLRHFDSSYVSAFSVFQHFNTLFASGFKSDGRGESKEAYVYGEEVLGVARRTDSGTAGVTQGARTSCNLLTCEPRCPLLPPPGGRWSGLQMLQGLSQTGGQP